MMVNVQARADVASGNPSTQEIIRALQFPIKTRSLRNLVVNAPQGATESEPAEQPSVSLTIEFGFDSAKISITSRRNLESLAKALTSAELKNSRFLIEGHTDAKGSVKYNQKLSERRAQSVKTWLTKHGVDTLRLDAIGKGIDGLARPDDPLAAENRRVRIVNLD